MGGFGSSATESTLSKNMQWGDFNSDQMDEAVARNYFKLSLDTDLITDGKDRRWNLTQDNEIGFLSIVWDNEDAVTRRKSTFGGTAFIARILSKHKDGDAIMLLMTAGHNVQNI